MIVICIANDHTDWLHNIQYKDAQHNDPYHLLNTKSHVLSKLMNAFILSVIVLIIIRMRVILLCVILMSVIMFNVIMLCVIVLVSF